MKQRTLIGLLWRTVWGLVAALALTACDGREGELPVVPGEEACSDCRLVFTIRTEKEPVRAVVYDEVGTLNENRIDLENGDYRLYLFAGSKGTDATCVAELSFQAAVRSADYTEYIVWTTIPASFFREHNYSMWTSVDYQLMMLANWESLGATYPAPGTATTVADVLNRKPAFNVPTASWAPYENGAKGIPMYGLLGFTASSEGLSLPPPNVGDSPDRVNAGTLYLLRAMAKVELWEDFYDETVPAERRYNEITDVKLVAPNATGLCIPASFVNGEQVESPTYPDGVEKAGTPLQAHRKIAADGRAVWQLYTAESPSADRPLKVTVRTYPNPADRNTWTSAEYLVDMTPYVKKNEDDPGEALLRNHIYRLYAKSVHSTLEFKYVVCPWEKKEVDIPAFE